MKRTVDTDEAAAAVGAYSQGTTNGDVLFTAGQLPLTPDGELLDDEPIDVQARQSLENVEAILAAEGLELSDVLKVTVFLDDVADFAEMNDAYADFFGDSQPARSAIEVGAVPKGADIEIEAVADAAGE